MNVRTILFLLAISAFFVSCEDIVELELSDKDIGMYAIEAKITTDNNPYVFLYKSQRINSDEGYPGVSGAKVVITDNSEPPKSINLQESDERQGLYLPTHGTLFWGEQSREYTLTITVEGITMSSTEFLAPVELIDSIHVRPSLRGEKLFLGIFGYGNEPQGPGNYYKWDIYINKIQLSSSNYLVIASDELVDGNYFNSLELFTDFHDIKLPKTSILKLGDTIQVKQTSISKFTYTYYYQMINQAQAGDPFSVPSANIKSNIVSSDGRNVAGLFTASDVSVSNTIIIDEIIISGLKR